MSIKPRAPGARTVTLDVSLLGRDYKVACKEGEEGELKDAVAFLDRRMRDVRENSKSSSSAERIAVMAALNVVHEFQRERAAPSPQPPAPRPTEANAETASASIDAAAVRRRIVGMRSAIELVLSGQESSL